MLLDCDYRTHSVNMLSDLKGLNIKDRLNFHKMCLVYKCRNGLVRRYLVDIFSNVSDKHEFYTRTQTCQTLNRLKPKSNQLKRSFKYSVLNWNNLNPVIRNATSLNIFKSAFIRSHSSTINNLDVIQFWLVLTVCFVYCCMYCRICWIYYSMPSFVVFCLDRIENQQVVEYVIQVK